VVLKLPENIYSYIFSLLNILTGVGNVANKDKKAELRRKTSGFLQNTLPQSEL
jgi:hypothetical protein